MVFYFLKTTGAKFRYELRELLATYKSLLGHEGMTTNHG